MSQKYLTFVFPHVQGSLKQTCVCVQKSKVWKWNSSDPVVLFARQPGSSRSGILWPGDCPCCPSVTHPQPPAGQVGPWTPASKVRKCPQEGHLWPRFFPIYLSGCSEFWEQLLASVVRGAQDGIDCQVYNRNGAVHAASFSWITVYHT